MSVSSVVEANNVGFCLAVHRHNLKHEVPGLLIWLDNVGVFEKVVE